MPERLIVSVDAPSDHPTVLRVEDAFEHILELFELSKASAQADADAVIWRLVTVRMNSPLTVVAEAYSYLPNVNIDASARAQKAQFARNLEAMRRGEIPPAWSHGVARINAKNVLERSARQIGNTKIVLDQSEESEQKFELTRADALISMVAFDEIPANVPLLKPKEQVGSIEGYFIQVSTHYNKPALLLKERKTGSQIWCVVSEENQRKIAGEADFNDVWSSRRIVASGRLFYNEHGALVKVVATNIRRIEGKEVSFDSILDRGFTGDLSSAEYLENFREGNLG